MLLKRLPHGNNSNRWAGSVRSEITLPALCLGSVVVIAVSVKKVSSLPTILEAVFITLSSLLLWRRLMPPNHTHVENARILSIAER